MFFLLLLQMPMDYMPTHPPYMQQPQYQMPYSYNVADLQQQQQQQSLVGGGSQQQLPGGDKGGTDQWGGDHHHDKHVSSLWGPWLESSILALFHDRGEVLLFLLLTFFTYLDDKWINHVLCCGLSIILAVEQVVQLIRAPSLLTTARIIVVVVTPSSRIVIVVG